MYLLDAAILLLKVIGFNKCSCVYTHVYIYTYILKVCFCMCGYIWANKHAYIFYQDWKHMEYTIGHITLAQLANIQNLCKGCPDIKSKCLYLTGKCLHLLAINIDPVHSEIYWKPNIMVCILLYIEISFCV